LPKDPFYATELYILNIGIIKNLMNHEKLNAIFVHGSLAIIVKDVYKVPIVFIAQGIYADETR
jgi:hypothetical protein